jgi:hypothetical protein
MARKKEQLKPLFAVKFDFVESLDHFISEVMTLRQAVGTALELDLVKEPAKKMLSERLASLAAAMDTGE